MTLRPEATAAYARMAERFQQRVLRDGELLQEALCQLRAQGAAWQGHEALCQLAHQLAGLGGTFGFAPISEASLQLESTLMTAHGERDPGLIEADIVQLLQALAQAHPAPPP